MFNNNTRSLVKFLQLAYITSFYHKSTVLTWEKLPHATVRAQWNERGGFYSLRLFFFFHSASPEIPV